MPSGRLRINAPPPAIDLVLAPMVAPFLRAYPQVDLEIVGDSSFVDIVADGFDAGVRYGEHLADMIATLCLAASQHAWQHAIRRLVVVEEGSDVDDHLLAHLDAALDGGRAHMRQQRRPCRPWRAAPVSG